MEIQEEKYIPFSPIPVPIEGIDKISFQMKNNICKIFKKEPIIIGTGFFWLIPFQNKLLHVLITNNHVLKEEDLKIGNVIILTINNNNERREIKIDNSRKIITSKSPDITIVEIKPNEDKIYNFLEIDNDAINNKDKDLVSLIYKGKSIYILHYPESRNMHASLGILNDVIENEIYHYCSTNKGSSGSPILSLETFKVIGIHYGCFSGNFNINRGIFMQIVINEFNNKYKKQIQENNIIFNNNIKIGINKIMKKSTSNPQIKTKNNISTKEKEITKTPQKINNSKTLINQTQEKQKFNTHNRNDKIYLINLKKPNKIDIFNLNNKLQQNQNEKNNLNNQIQQNQMIANKAINEIHEKQTIINLNKKIHEIQYEKNHLEVKNKQIIEIQNKTNNEFQILKNQYELKENQLKNYERTINELKEKIEEYTIPTTIGLDNIGAQCYMNATLQSLSNTPPLANYFLNKYKYNQNDKNKIMSNEFFIVLQNLWNRKNNKKSYAPYSFKNVLSKENPLFAGIQANDSKDLINFLLERFHEELNEAKIQQNNTYLINQVDQLDENKMLNIFLNEIKSKYYSIISNLFYGIMENKIKCQSCQNIKYSFNICYFLDFPLEQVNKYCFNKGLRNNISTSNKIPDVNLYECFNYFRNSFSMTGDNQIYCNICNIYCDALYEKNLYSLPNFLIINLNRGRGAVYECKVNFPEKLNLLNYVVQKENTYLELYAVISHIGPSSMSGNFVAYCKHHIDNKWYKYNDSIVTPCTEINEYKEGMPYILFYKGIWLIWKKNVKNLIK